MDRNQIRRGTVAGVSLKQTAAGGRMKSCWWCGQKSPERECELPAPVRALLEFGDVRDTQEQPLQLREQAQAIITDSGVVGIHQHLVEEVIDRGP